MLTNLDKSAQLSTSQIKWQKKARYKAFQINLCKAIEKHLKHDSRERNYVTRARFCQSVITQSYENIRVNYCNSRLCNTCEKIRKAKRIDAYLKPLQSLNNPYFVTLTKRSVNIEDLRKTIQEMSISWRKIRKNFNKRKLKSSGIRTLEFNYNSKTNKYNPHYHIIIDTEENAKLLKSLWLKQDSTLSKYANDIRIIKNPDTKTLLEVFAYTTKTIYKNKVYPKVLADSITSLMDIRTIQTFGNIRKQKTEDLENLISSKLDFKEITYNEKEWIWDNEFKDWRFEDELLSEVNYTNQDIYNLSMLNVNYLKSIT